jgi:hypothetical protein
MEKTMSRRAVFKWGLGAIALLPVLKSTLLQAAEACAAASAAIKDKVLDPNSAVAKRLDYVESMGKDFSHKAFKAGSDCGNCRFFIVARKDGQWAPCTMAANKYVPSCGWCKSYALDPKKKA